MKPLKFGLVAALAVAAMAPVAATSKDAVSEKARQQGSENTGRAMRAAVIHLWPSNQLLVARTCAAGAFIARSS